MTVEWRVRSSGSKSSGPMHGGRQDFENRIRFRVTYCTGTYKCLLGPYCTANAGAQQNKSGRRCPPTIVTFHGRLAVE